MQKSDQNTNSMLKQHFEEALRRNSTVYINMNTISGSAFTKFLRIFVYRETPQSTLDAHVRAIYADGSLGDACTLRCLLQRNPSYEPALRKISPLRAALLSMRHCDLDARVDMAWLSNRDIASLPSQAIVEQFSYQQTRLQLQQGLRLGPLKLHLYHTGYLPAVIGFYRAVIDELQLQDRHIPILEVIPYYYYAMLNHYDHGQPWN